MLGEIRNADRIWASTPQNLASGGGGFSLLLKCPLIFRIHYSNPSCY